MPDLAPLKNGRNGDRDALGRFRPGNPGGPGNPIARKTAAIRKALFAAVKADDIRAMVRALVARARGGDVLACRELLNRLIGRPGIAEGLLEQVDESPTEIVFRIVDAPADDGDRQPEGD
jgi:hypothetical protein